jgi:hypothetical protein
MLDFGTDLLNPLKAMLSGRGSEIIDLAKTNLSR